MNLKEKFFNLFGLFVEKKTDNEKIKKILSKLTPYKIPINIIRLGENNDGGYLIPDDLKGIKHCYTAGVGNLTKFEKDLYEYYKIESTLADPSEIDVKILPEKSFFINKKVSIYDSDKTISINNFIKSEKDIILKIDIEREEYENLLNINDYHLKNTRILILELHDLRNLRSEFFFSLFEKILDRLSIFFYICHLHPNNSGKVKKIGNYNIPDMIEITLINKKRLENFPKEIAQIPHSLDQKIDPNKNEIFIDKNWFQ